VYVVKEQKYIENKNKKPTIIGFDRLTLKKKTFELAHFIATSSLSTNVIILHTPNCLMVILCNTKMYEFNGVEQIINHENKNLSELWMFFSTLLVLTVLEKFVKI